jgi:hypothetical protein
LFFRFDLIFRRFTTITATSFSATSPPTGAFVTNLHLEFYMKLLSIVVVIVVTGAVSVASADDFTGLGLAVDMQFKSSGGTGYYSEAGNGESFTQRLTMGGEQDVIVVLT